MILVDTGPLIALFDPADGDHAWCLNRLKIIDEPIATTTPVLTDAFHLLGPASIGSRRLMEFIGARGLEIRFLDDADLARAFELMVRYADHPMDLADASLVALAKRYRLRKIFTLDQGDFRTYRIRQGQRHLNFEILSDAD